MNKQLRMSLLVFSLGVISLEAAPAKQRPTRKRVYKGKQRRTNVSRPLATPQPEKPVEKTSPVVARVKEPNLFELGKENSLAFLDYLNTGIMTKESVNKTFNEIATKVFQNTPDCEGYDENYEKLREWHRGVKAGLATFTPLTGDDILSLQKNIYVKVSEVSADMYIEAKNHVDFMEKWQQKAQEMKDDFITLQRPSPLTATRQGTAVAAIALNFITEQARGNTVYQEERDAYKKEIEDFFSLQADKSPEERTIYLKSFFNGMKSFLENAELSKLMKDIPQEKAEALHKEYQAELQRVNEGLALLDK